MRDSTTETEREYYHRNGFVTIEALLNEAELELWHEVIGGAYNDRATRLPTDVKNYEIFQTIDEYYQQTFVQKINLWMTSDSARPLVLDKGLGHLAAELAGVQGVRMWQDQALVKEAYANPTAFHLDVPNWSFTSKYALTIWIALSDATLENGCLCYIPGSHLAERYDNVRIGKGLGSLFEVYPEWKDIDPVFCPVKAGDAVIHNGLTAHGAGANMTPHRRFAMTMAYMPDGCRFNGNPNILSHDRLERLSVGDLLDDEEQCPLVFSFGT